MSPTGFQDFHPATLQKTLDAAHCLLVDDCFHGNDLLLVFGPPPFERTLWLGSHRGSGPVQGKQAKRGAPEFLVLHHQTPPKSFCDPCASVQVLDESAEFKRTPRRQATQVVPSMQSREDLRYRTLQSRFMDSHHRLGILLTAFGFCQHGTQFISGVLRRRRLKR